jgi:hypothetical protein
MRLLDACWFELLLGQKQDCALADSKAIQMTRDLEIVVRVMNMKAFTWMGDHAFEFSG